MLWLLFLLIVTPSLSSIGAGDIYAIEPNATDLSRWYLHDNASRGICYDAPTCAFYMWSMYEIWNGHGGQGCAVVGSQWHYVNESYAPWARWACFDDKFDAPIAHHSYCQFNNATQYEGYYYLLLVKFTGSWIMAKFR